MPKKLSLLLFFYFTIFLSLGQPEINYPVCSLDDTPISPKEVTAQALSIDHNDVLREYLRDIKQILSINSTQYVLKKITQRATACAMIVKNGNVMERTIAINADYYASKVTSYLKKAMFIWIIGHEITHHRNDDHFYLNEKDLLKNITKEVLCDENAGYLVGKLTTDISLRDVSTILTSILRNNDSSIYYPPLKYRIHAASAGWLRAKAEQATSDQPFDILGSRITRHVEQNKNGVRKHIKAEHGYDSLTVVRQEFEGGHLYFGTGSGYMRHGYGVYLAKYELSESFDEITYGRWINNDPVIAKEIRSTIAYIGEFNEQNWSGKGEIFGYSSLWKNNRYVGQFSNGKRNGFGIFYFRDGSRFMGEWVDGDRTGYGVLYLGDKVIHAGYWKNGEFIGENCKNGK